MGDLGDGLSWGSVLGINVGRPFWGYLLGIFGVALCLGSWLGILDFWGYWFGILVEDLRNPGNPLLGATWGYL
jgi:hypothetical protein